MAAAQTAPSSTASKNGGDQKPQKPKTQGTSYIVLRREQVTVDKQKLEAWVPVLNQTAQQGPDLQPRVFRAPSKAVAVRQHTGDGANVKEGTFRAIPLSSWKGGVTTKRVYATERMAID